jgi:hypothetical protein
MEHARDFHDIGPASDPAPAPQGPIQPCEPSVIDLDRSPEALVPDQQPRVTWENRRRMAWSCLVFFFALVLYTGLWMPLDRLEKADNFLQNALWVCFAIVSVYMGSTSLATVWAFRKR